MKIIMDTHMHSKASDGTWTPREVVMNAKQRGLEIIALTDHDTIFGLEEAIKAGREYGIKVIPGIELDVFQKYGEIKIECMEMLGLNVDPSKIKLFSESRGQARMKAFGEYVEAYNEYLNSPRFHIENERRSMKIVDFSPVSVEEAISWKNGQDGYENPSPFVSKLDFVNYLAKTRAQKSELTQRVGFDKAATDKFKEEYPLFLSSKAIKPTLYEAIAEIKNADGKSVIAHPGASKGYRNGMIKEWRNPEEMWFKDNGEFTPCKLISDLKDHGLDGIEIYNYRGNDKEHAAEHDLINRYFSRMADVLGLIKTYGSDCHGEKCGGARMGTFGSSESYLDKLGGTKCPTY